jgi:DUF1009 family protein
VPPKLGILAGTGELPRRLVEACRAAGREVFVVTFEGENENRELAGAPGATLPLGAVGRTFEALRQAGCTEVVMAGRFRRPALTSLRPDLRGARLLPKIVRAGGDDALLRVLASEIESEGFRVIGPEDVLPRLLASRGPLGAKRPTAADERDIARGVAVLKALSPFDVGQAVVVEGERVLGIEGPEGTDALIDRSRAFRSQPGKGFLVKMMKAGQDARVDRPAIGPGTVERISAAGLAGIACEAGATLIIDAVAVGERADALGVFLTGVDAAT